MILKKLMGISLALVLLAALLMGCGGSTDTTTSKAATTTSAAATTSKPATTSLAPTTSVSGAPTSITPTTSTTTSPATTVKTTTAAATTTASSGTSFADVMTKFNSVTNFYCEIKMTSVTGGVTTTANYKYWAKMGTSMKYRMEFSTAGQSMVMIYDGQYYYTYYPDTKYGTKMSAAAAQQYASASTDAGDVAQYNPIYIGSETVNGVDCYHYRYTVQGGTSDMWLSKQNGMTIRMVSGTTTMDYTNFSYAPIADSMFMMPADVIMMTIPGM